MHPFPAYLTAALVSAVAPIRALVHRSCSRGARLWAALDVGAVLLFGLAEPACWGAPVDRDHAFQVAGRWLKLSPNPLRQPAGKPGKVSAYANALGEVRFYVVSLEPTGYVVIAADDEVEPILAFSPVDRFVAQPGHPLYELLQKDTDARTRQLRTRPIGRLALSPLPAREKAKWERLGAAVPRPAMADGTVNPGGAEPTLAADVTTLDDVRVDPLTHSRWNQDTLWNGTTNIALYNWFTPPGPEGSAGNYPAGCVATAWAQLLRFHQWPQVGVGRRGFTITVNGVSQSVSLRGGDGAGGPYNWADMVLDPGADITVPQCQAIGALLKDVGVANNMSYTRSSSAAYVSTDWLTEYFHYANAVTLFCSLKDVLLASRTNLDAGLPVAVSMRTASNIGHLVICDGYGYNFQTLYHHLNMGWGGACDTWYNLPDVDTGYYLFNNLVSCSYNIDPLVAGEIISGRIADAAGHPVAGVTVTVSGPSTATAVTNARGLFAVKGLASRATWVVTHDGAARGIVPAQVTVTTGDSAECLTVGNRVVDDFCLILPLKITAQPVNQCVFAGMAASFTVAVSDNPTPSLQWQVSTDGGSHWSDLADTSPYSGTGTVKLTITGVTAAMYGYQYRCVASNAPAKPAISDAAILSLALPGSLWAMGDNGYGQLGDGSTTDRATPTPILARGVQAMSAGVYHSLVVKTDGSLWAMGSNYSGRLGDGTTTDRTVPALVLASGVQTVAAGGYHSLFVKTDGSLWAMGENDYGQLGDGTTTARTVPVLVLASGVQAVSAGGGHSLIVKTDGSLWATGINSHGQLGDGTTTNRPTPVQILASGVQAVSAGGGHSLIVKTDGSLWAMGENLYGQLGDGTTMDRPTPVQILASGVQAVAAGSYHSLIVKTDGSLWAMGNNFSRQLGDGTATDRVTPVLILASGVQAVAAGGYHSLIVKTDGSLWAMGANSDGQLGDGMQMARETPVPILASGVQAVAAGNLFSLVVAGGNADLWVPQIASQPIAKTVCAGTSATFAVTVTCPIPLTYQWQVSTDGGASWCNVGGEGAYTGADTNLLTVLRPAKGITGYQYRCVISNGVAPSVLTQGASLTVGWSQLAALSARAPVGTGDQTLILGFVFAGGGKPTMVRGVGPGLIKGDANLAGQELVDPQLTLNELQAVNGGAQFVAIAANDNWGGTDELRTQMSALGMGALDDASADAALLTTPTRAVYTAQISGANQTTGLALAEVYDADVSDKAKRLTALSIRNQVGAGSSVLIAGLVIDGDAPKRVIIRGVGPGLVPTVAAALVLANPTLQLYQRNTTTSTWSVVGTNDDWGGSTELATAMSQAGMGPLAADSKDAVLLVELQPGVYTVQLSGVGDTTGIGLVEIYEAP